MGFHSYELSALSTILDSILTEITAVLRQTLWRSHNHHFYHIYHIETCIKGVDFSTNTHEKIHSNIIFPTSLRIVDSIITLQVRRSWFHLHSWQGMNQAMVSICIFSYHQGSLVRTKQAMLRSHGTQPDSSSHCDKRCLGLLNLPSSHKQYSDTIAWVKIHTWTILFNYTYTYK